MIRLSAAAVLIAACIAPLKAGSQTLTGNGKSEGYLRFGVQYHDQQRATTDVALGGRFGFETAERWHMSAGAGFYTSQGFGHHDNQGYPFYDNDNHSYSILGDAYLKGKWGGSTLILGRQQIDTPFADSDDNGMVPNRFEAYTLLNSDIEGATIMFSHLVKWSGVDAPDPGRFTSLNPGHGVQMLGAIYEGMEDIALSCWYYHIEGMADLIYLESARQWHHGFGDLTLGLQYADEDYSEGKAQVWGLRGEVGLPWGLSLSTAYNKTLSTHDMSADNFFGGGPYFSSSQNLTIAEAGPDGQALMATVSLDGAAGITGSYLEVAVLHIEGDGGIKADEVDTVVGYEAGEDLTFDLIYSDIKDRKESSNSFKNLRFFANYQF